VSLRDLPLPPLLPLYNQYYYYYYYYYYYSAAKRQPQLYHDSCPSSIPP